MLIMNTNQPNTLSKLHYQRVCHVAQTIGPGTLLVSLRPGQPRPTTLAESKSEEHQLDLAESDTGVAPGLDSGGLCAMGLPDRKVLEVFLAANPALRGVLCVEHPGFTALLRVDGSVPASRLDGALMWLSNGSAVTLVCVPRMVIRRSHPPPNRSTTPRSTTPCRKWSSRRDARPVTHLP